MDSFELNKVLGAILFTLLVVLSLSIVAEALYHPDEPEVPGYAIAALDPGGDGGEAGEAEEVEAVPIAVLLQDADPEAGAQAARKCQSCHTFEEGGANRVGPNLWDIVGAPMAHADDFNYSAAMTEMEAGDEVWTFEKLNAFLLNPKAAVPGTAMAFAGLRRDEERGDVIAYLRTLSNSPVPLPEAPVETAAEEPADEAEGEAAEDGAADSEVAPGGEPDAAPQGDDPEAGETEGPDTVPADEAETMSPEAPPIVPVEPDQ